MMAIMKTEKTKLRHFWNQELKNKIWTPKIPSTTVTIPVLQSQLVRKKQMLNSMILLNLMNLTKVPWMTMTLPTPIRKTEAHMMTKEIEKAIIEAVFLKLPREPVSCHKLWTWAQEVRGMALASKTNFVRNFETSLQEKRIDLCNFYILILIIWSSRKLKKEAWQNANLYSCLYAVDGWFSFKKLLCIMTHTSKESSSHQHSWHLLIITIQIYWYCIY